MDQNKTDNPVANNEVYIGTFFIKRNTFVVRVGSFDKEYTTYYYMADASSDYKLCDDICCVSVSAGYMDMTPAIIEITTSDHFSEKESLKE